MNRQKLTVDLGDFIILRDQIGDREIINLPLDDAGKLAKHFEEHPDTIQVDASGVNLSSEINVFNPLENQIAIEWVKHETNPKKDEPPVNVYRYIFGITTDSECIGMDVTHKPTSGRVADHWPAIEDFFNDRFSPRPT